MILYHGSNVVVEKPRLLKSDRKLDFGMGFYLTSSFEQAERWAKVTTKRREIGTPCISVFDFSENETLSILKFEAPNSDWLKYVSANRIGNPVSDNYDIVTGPVANDNTMPVLNFYFSGIYTEEETIKRLLPQKLNDQFAFKTENALSCLTFSKVVKI